MFKRFLLLLVFLPLLVLGQKSNQVWKYDNDGDVRDEWSNDSLYFNYVTSGADSITSRVFTTPEGYNGLLSLFYNVSGTMTNVSFKLLYGTSAGYVVSDEITFTEETADDTWNNLSNVIYFYKTDGTADDIEGAAVYTYKVRMIAGAAVNIKIRMGWSSY